MKIENDVTRALRPADSANTTKTTASTAARPAEAAPAIGSVQISDTSRALQAAGVSNAEAPFDAQRVEAIKAAISAGHFKVNPEAIADKLIDSVGQLLTGKS
ncbi:MAG: flagellar biosynthesis anti-sigma factor FlgM [Burkholderiaceae bacterium]